MQRILQSTVDFNSSTPRQNGRHFADDIFKRIFLNEKVSILIRISVKFVPKGSRVPTGPYFREKSLFSIVALPALEKSLLLNIFDRSPGKVLIFNRCVKTWMINIVLRKLRFSKCCGNDVELFGNPSDPLTNHRWRVVWRHLVPAKIPRASFIKFYNVVTLSQSADTWCHVVVVRNLIGPQSRRYTWRTLLKQNIEHIRGNTATYLRLNSTNEWSVCT